MGRHVKADLGTLDRVVKETVGAIEKGKEQMYSISEIAETESLRVQKELQSLRSKTLEIIQEVDGLERKEKLSRVRLATVSSNFVRFTEADIKQAYEETRDLQIMLAQLREREAQLRKQRDEMERSLKTFNETAARARELVTQVGVVLDFITGTLHDVNERIESLQQRQMLGLKIIKAQEEERKRIAREIHDGPAQSFANVVLRMEFCEKLLEVDVDKAKAEIRDLKEFVRESLQDIRKVIFDLRPMALDDLGIVPAVKRYISDFGDKYGIPIQHQFFGRETRFKPALEIAVFRLIQECLNNIRKHAHATEVKVRVELGEEWINIMVSDNGKGFDLEKVLADKKRDSFGLISMRERVTSLEGEFNIYTALAKGTEVVIRIPVREEAGDHGPH